MSHYRMMLRLFVIATLGAFSSVGCFSADDDGDGGGDDDDGGGLGSGAVMKFCNELYKIDQTTGAEMEARLTITFEGVNATALSGTCTPLVPRPCISIPAVTDPTVVLTDTDVGTEIISGSIPTLTVARGDELLVLATVDATDYPTVEAGQFNAQFVCSETDPFATMLETRSAPASLHTPRDLRAPAGIAASRWVRRATLPAR